MNTPVNRWLLKLFFTLFLFSAAPLSWAQDYLTNEPTPGVTDSSILLGQSSAFSGPAAAIGRESRRGAMLYFDYINHQGGVHGRRIFMISLDDGYEPDRTVANSKILLEKDKVFALFNYLGTANTMAMLPIIAEHKVPYINPFTGADQFRDPVNPYIYNVRPSYFQETAALVDYLVKQGKRNIAVFYQNDGFGKAGLEGVRRAMKKNNLSISALGTVERNSTDMTDAVKRIAAAKPDGVILVTVYAASAEFIRQAKKLPNLKESLFLNLSVVNSKALVKDLWTDSKDVVVAHGVPFPASTTIPLVEEYTRVSRIFSEQALPSYGSLEGYVAAKLFVEGLERAGRDLTRANLVDALNTLSNFDLGGMTINWTPDNHYGADFIDITVIGDQDRWVY